MISVIIPTHNPNQTRLERTLAGLVTQTLPRDRWNVIVVDNASQRPVTIEQNEISIRVVQEKRLGLTSARLRGVEDATGELVLFVDDDNVLFPDYLEHVEEIAHRYPRIGAFGGKSIPEWEQSEALPEWIDEFSHNLAIRDLGDKELVADPNTIKCYPVFSPVGAGMALRKAAIIAWVESVKNGSVISDRCGKSLTSGGDNDIVLHCLKAGFTVGYFPMLKLHHIIPRERLTPSYQARLSYAMTRSWVAVLHRHQLCPWKPIAPWTSSLRKAKSFFRTAAWSSARAWIRWRGTCGLIDAQSDISRVHRAS